MPSNAMRLAPLMVATALTGCAAISEQKAAETGFADVQRLVADRTPERIAWNRGAAEDAAVATAVADMLAKPLTDAAAVQVALLNNPGLQAAYEDIGVAQADLVQAGLLRNPVVSFAAGWPTTGDDPPKLDFGLTATFLDLLWRPARTKVAAERFEQVKLAVADKVIDLSAETRAAYFRHLAAAQTAQILREVAQAAQASYDLLARLEAAGNVSERQRLSAQIALEDAKMELAEAEGEVAASREALNRLMGLQADQTGWTVGDTLPPVPPQEPPLERVESAVIDGNLKLAAAKREIAAKAAALGLTDATRLWSEADIGVAAERDTDGTWLVGPSLDIALPLFDQGRPSLAKAAAEYRQEAKRLVQTAIDLRSEARELRDRLVRTRDLATHYRTRLIPLHQRLVQLGLAEYNYMLIGPFEVLAARQAEIHAYRRYIEAVRDFWLAQVALDRLAGGRAFPAASGPAIHENQTTGGPS
jgi:cobalt-zinc-cadmium efflux system outer membrane protein